jgi:hypothetical protein
MKIALIKFATYKMESMVLAVEPKDELFDFVTESKEILQESEDDAEKSECFQELLDTASDYNFFMRISQATASMYFENEDIHAHFLIGFLPDPTIYGEDHSARRLSCTPIIQTGLKRACNVFAQMLADKQPIPWIDIGEQEFDYEGYIEELGNENAPLYSHPEYPTILLSKYLMLQSGLSRAEADKMMGEFGGKLTEEILCMNAAEETWHLDERKVETFYYKLKSLSELLSLSPCEGKVYEEADGTLILETPDVFHDFLDPVDIPKAGAKVVVKDVSALYQKEENSLEK